MRSSFITWYPYCRRSDTIAEALGGPSHLVHYLSFKRPLHAPFKYVAQTLTTLRILAREQPDLVLTAVPPIFAVLPIAWYVRRHPGTRFVVDAHTGIFESSRWRWLMPLTKRIFARADAVIVTGEHLRQVVAGWGARAVVIGDVPVRFGPTRAPAPCRGPRIVVVNTFSEDEPLPALLAAARRLDEASFFVTGDVRYADPGLMRVPPANVTFTGFLPEPDYAGLLQAADAVVVLTTRDHTMQRGGYEAVALGRPLVTSDWGILRETFSRGTVHVRNDDDAIAAGIRRALVERDRLAGEMRRLRAERRAIFAERLDWLLRTVGAPGVAEVG